MNTNSEFAVKNIFYFNASNDFLAFAKEIGTNNDIMFLILGSGEKVYMLHADAAQWSTLNKSALCRVVQIISSAVINGLEVMEIEDKIDSIIPNINCTGS